MLSDLAGILFDDKYGGKFLYIYKCRSFIDPHLFLNHANFQTQAQSPQLVGLQPPHIYTLRCPQTWPGNPFDM